MTHTPHRFFTVEGTDYGPYEAQPVSVGWDAYEPILVTRAVAEQIVHDLNVLDAGCGLTADWDGSVLIFNEEEHYRGEPGKTVVGPNFEGLYGIGGWWPWDTVDADEIHNDPQDDQNH